MFTTQTITFFYSSNEECPRGLYDEPTWANVEVEYELELDAHQVAQHLIGKGVPPHVVEAMIENEADNVGEYWLSDYIDTILTWQEVEYTDYQTRMVFGERYERGVA